MDDCSDLASHQLRMERLFKKINENLEKLISEAHSMGKNKEIIYCSNGQEEVFRHLQAILWNDQPHDPIIQQQGRSFCIKRPSEVMEMQEEGNQANMEICYSDSPYNVINMVGENWVVKGDLKMTNEWNKFLEFCSSMVMNSTPEQRGTIWTTLYAVQFAQLWALGNPFDKLFHSTSTGKGTEESLLSFGQACSMFLPAIIWSGMFLLNFIYTAMLAWSLPYRVPANSMLVLSLLYYILALTGAMSGFTVLWGSVKMPGLLFVFGGTMSLLLLIGFIIMGVYATWRSPQT